MPAAQELTALGVRKELVRMRIAARRMQCVAAVEQLAPTIALADRGVTLWRSIPGRAKWIGIPAAFFLVRKFGKRFGGAAGLLRQAPAIIRLARSFAAPRQKDGAHPTSRAAK